MPLFWKIYLASLCLWLAAAALLTTAISHREAGRSLTELRTNYRLLATVAASQVEAGYHEKTWPFELLGAIAREPAFVSWQILDGAGRTVLTGRPRTAPGVRPAEAATPALPAALGAEPHLDPGPAPDTEIWTIPLRMRTGAVPWTFHLAFSRRCIREHVAALVLTNTGYAAAVSILLVPVSLLITRRMLRPLQSLTGALRQMEAGNLSVCLPPGGRDELGALAAGFNRMTAALRSSYADLQQSNQQLQSEIAQRARAEAELSRHRDHLEQLVAERTVDLTRANQQLAVDIARRERAERVLRDSEERYRVLYEGANDAILILQDDRIVDCNPKAVEAFGCPRAQLLGATPFDFSPPTQPDGQPSLAKGRAILAHAGAGRAQCFEWRHSRRDGSTFEAEVSLTQLNASGQTFCQALVRDITQRKEAEARAEALNQRLVETSRAVGQAEIATGVLHNVGNVLNSVNVSATLLREQLGKSRVANLGKAAALLGEHAADLGQFLTADPRGRQLPEYLAKLAGFLAAEQRGMLDEVSTLARNVDHIKEIVSRQQAYAKVAGLSQQVALAELADDALTINAAALERHRVQVVREFAALPPLLTDKHKVLQILVNLISNAKYAMRDAGGADRRLLVGTGWVPGRTDRVQIQVTDTGVGIAPENLTRIFSHGFTTRADGHGFGLHSGALAARDLGGSLEAFSAGPGKGATFILQLPLAVPAGQPAGPAAASPPAAPAPAAPPASPAPAPA